jgi:hypothetical protein
MQSEEQNIEFMFDKIIKKFIYIFSLLILNFQDHFVLNF